MFQKDIDKITEDDLQFLVDNLVLERKTMEYKSSLPTNSDSDKIKFLAHVSSFANANGGDLIYGIIEDRTSGAPQKLEGLDLQNIDQEKLRLENMIRNGIRPRLPSVSIHPIALSNSKTVLLLRILESWIGPHRVVYKGHDKFYSRNSAGKYPMDVSELRIAFNLSETRVEIIKNFKIDRTSKIIANETPVPCNMNARIILHIIPFSSLNPAQFYEIKKIAKTKKGLRPINCLFGKYYRYNFDGLLCYCGSTPNEYRGYVQLFRNGIIEAVEWFLLEPRKDMLVFPISTFEKEIIYSLEEYLNTIKILGIAPPIFIFFTLIGVKNYSIYSSLESQIRYQKISSYPIERNILSLPEVMIESYNERLDHILKPCFDSLWNAFGFSGSYNYDKDGNWIKSITYI